MYDKKFNIFFESASPNDIIEIGSKMNSESSINCLRIAQVAPLWTAVPPRLYGGAELMVHWLTEALVEMGHEVTLFASGDSITSANLQAVCNFNLLDTMERGFAYKYSYYAASNFAEALHQSNSFDVIHCHVGTLMIPFSINSRAPVLHTVHAGLDSVDELWVLNKYPYVPITAISNSQIAVLPRERQQNIQVIYHGCDFSTYEFSAEPGKYLAFIGRMGPHKNPVGAIRIAQASSIPIVLAGQPQNFHEKSYFTEEVKPLLDGNNVSYLGPITHREKVDLLKGAIALLFPIQWEEHFGLVMIEAMACGTPVIGWEKGSVREVVDFGKTGFYGNSEKELVSLVPRAILLKRESVHKHALSRFTHWRMANEYVDLYNSLIKN
jgi:glycosyltransferase involved in cell wall biosynthesis